MNIRRPARASLMTTLLLAMLASAHAEQPDQNWWGNDRQNYRAAKYACKSAIREKVWSDHSPRVRKVEFHGAIDTYRESRDRTGVRGKGRFLNRKQRWKEFDFNCVYSNSRDRIVSASYRKDDDDWDDDGYATRESRSACVRSVQREVKRRRPNASRIHWIDRTVRASRESRSRVRYAGSGDYIGGRGNKRSFDFECVYDLRNHDVVHVTADTSY